MSVLYLCMFRDFLNQAGATQGAIAVLMGFVTLFILGVIWVFRRQRKPVYQQLSHLPLEKEDSCGQETRPTQRSFL